MRHGILIAVMVWGLGASGTALRAQSALQTLEDKVRADNRQGAAAAEPPAEAVPHERAGSAAAEPGYLGLLADDRGGGVRILELTVGAPAETAGLRAGDVVTAIDTRPIHSMRDFEAILLRSPAGTKLTFQVQRAGQDQHVVVTLGQRPAPAERRFEFGRIPGPEAVPSQPRPAVLGVRLATITPELQQTYALPAPRGALVVDVVPGSPAEKAGLPVEAVIVFIDGVQIDTPADVSRLVAAAGPGKELKLSYFSRGQLAERRVTLEGPPSEPIVAARPPAAELDRVQALERRIAELERRLAELEQALKKQP